MRGLQARVELWWEALSRRVGGELVSQMISTVSLPLYLYYCDPTTVSLLYDYYCIPTTVSPLLYHYCIPTTQYCIPTTVSLPLYL